jgi:hypothetical protein
MGLHLCIIFINTLYAKVNRFKMLLFAVHPKIYRDVKSIKIVNFYKLILIQYKRYVVETIWNSTFIKLT